MYKTHDEIFGQHVALRQTYAFLQGSADKIKDFYGISGFYSVTYTGCGASYALCRSAELSLKVRGGLTTMSFPAGDLMMSMPYYRDMLGGTLMVAPSRSGSTTELLSALEKARREAGALVIALTAMPESALSKIADLCLEMPWILDEGSCATRSTTNLYAATLYSIGLLSGDLVLLDEIRQAADNQESFIERNTDKIEKVARSGTWDRVLVLADGELTGVGMAGAIAVRRMARIPAHHANMLDVRHGDLSMLSPRTLVVAAPLPLDDAYQSMLLHQLRDIGAQVVTLSEKEDNIFGADLNICAPSYKNFAVRGIPMLFLLQAIGYFRALADGHNPDETPGFVPWVRL